MIDIDFLFLGPLSRTRFVVAAPSHSFLRVDCYQAVET